MKRIRATHSIGNSIIAYHGRSRSARFLSKAACLTESSPAPRPNSTATLRPTVQSKSCKTTPQLNSRNVSTSPPTNELRKTPLYDLHMSYGAKIVPFGGFNMPVQYDSLSVSASHHFTRSHASLFDVSHMVQHHFSGPGAIAFLQTVTPAGLASLGTHHSTLSTFLLRNTGGIVDDTVITRLGPQLFYVVTNAACRDKDVEYIENEIAAFSAAGGEWVEWEVLDGWGLIAIQGPLSAEILEDSLAYPEEARLKDLYFGQSKFLRISLTEAGNSKPLLISRGGYTGEDGFEISISPEETVAVTETLLENAGSEKLQLAGLGARDSLRLEAGMCLYGHDLDETTTPVEASLSWIIGKDRKVEGGFNGAEVIQQQLIPKSKGGQGVERRRVGLIVEGAPAREGAEIVDEKGVKIGVITSGCPSPTLGKNIAMGYIKDGFHKSGTSVDIIVRGKKRKAQVTKMPFVPSKYWKGTAAT